MNKRHAKPTSAQLIDRIYRKHLAFEAAILAEHDDQTAQYRHVKDMLETLISGQRMLSERMESFRVLADHCARLLREKETLMKMVSRPMPLKQADDFMAMTWRANGWMHENKSCSFAGTHRLGILCGVCGTRGEAR